MKIQQIRYVLEIANQGSLNKAAQSLFISQPTLSAAVKELERELAIQIFERSNQGISLTADGIEFLQLGKRLLEEADAIKSRYALEQRVPLHQFQVSCQHYAFVAEAFINFVKNMAPQRYTYGIKESKTLMAIEDVYYRRSALGILCLTPQNKKFITQILDKWGIDFQPLASVAPHVFIRKSHPLGGETSIDITDLEAYPMILYEQNNENHSMLTEELTGIENHPKIIYTSDRGTTNNIISNTDSFNIGTGYLIPQIIPEEITAIPLRGFDKQILLGWIHLKKYDLSEDVTLFVELVKDSLYRNYPYAGIDLPHIFPLSKP